MPTGTDCTSCPLRQLALFTAMSAEELAFMRQFKTGEVSLKKGATILSQGEGSPVLYTVLSGLGTRSVLLEDGRRQVINFVFPGDFLGLQAGIMGEMKHTVTAATPMVLCTFARSRVWELFTRQPERAYDLTWIAAMEEHFLGETVVTLGQRDATEGAEILVDIREVELASTFERALNIGDAVLVGQVNVNDQSDNSNYDAYELSISLESARVVLAEGETLILATGDTAEAYRRLVDAFADGVVSRLK